MSHSNNYNFTPEEWMKIVATLLHKYNLGELSLNMDDLNNLPLDAALIVKKGMYELTFKVGNHDDIRELQRQGADITLVSGQLPPETKH